MEMRLLFISPGGLTRRDEPRVLPSLLKEDLTGVGVDIDRGSRRVARNVSQVQSP